MPADGRSSAKPSRWDWTRGLRSFEERTLLDRARPYLIQIYRAALAHLAQLASCEPGDLQVERLIEYGLTPREAAVLARVARGLSNADVAAELVISERTVGKHLQRCYRKLGATNRSHAAAIVWDLRQRSSLGRSASYR